MRNQTKQVYELFVKAERAYAEGTSHAVKAALDALDAQAALDAACDAALAADVARDARYDVYCAKFRELFPLSKMEWASEKTDV